MTITPTAAPLTDDTFLGSIDFLSQSHLSLAGFMLSTLTKSVVITGTTANDYVGGSLVSDSLNANVSGSRFVGGRGDDILVGDLGNDTYLIRKGDGNDVITEKGGVNTIKFDKNISVSDLKVNRSGADLILKISDEQAVTVKNMFNAQTGAVVAANAIQSVKFYDTTSWDITTLKQQALLATTAGDDVIGGFETNDTLTGGKGNDQLNGGAGNDIYQYGLVDGNDVITKKTGTNIIALDKSFHKNLISSTQSTNSSGSIRFLQLIRIHPSQHIQGYGDKLPKAA